jgi:diguanylate cyclase (GGDEF)-like protein
MHSRPGDRNRPRGEKRLIESRILSRTKDLWSHCDGSSNEYRQEITTLLLRTTAVTGAIVFVPALIYAIRQGKRALTLTDSLAFATIIGLNLLLSTLRPRVMHIAMVSSFFGYGSIFLVILGFQSTGEIWLCAASVFATIFFGLRWGAALCAAEALILGGLGVAYRANGILGGDEALRYAVSSIVSVSLSLVISLVQEYLVCGMRRSIDVRGKFASELSARKEELAREAAGRMDAELRADFLESHDPLTRLFNRESFELALKRALEVAEGRGRILGVMAVELDRLKRIGETHGPGASDTILLEAAKRLARSFRDDDIVARSGGSTFLVLLSDVKTPEDARAIIDKSRQVFDRSFPVGRSEIGLSASFGLALFPHDGARAADLIGAAEVALHLAQDDGPGSYRLYDAALHERLIASGILEQEFRGALRSESFLPWYQPKVDGGGRIVGVEALARWVLPDGGIREPSGFISMAEGMGHIADLGRIVLAKACADAASWERTGLAPVPVSVNLSPYQFRSADIVRDVRNALSSTGLPASRLDLEITESGIMEDSNGSIEKLAELKALGCSISIDDFGTGYSSFAALRDFPVDCVKLPQSFVTPLPGDSRAGTIARAVIDLAHRLSFSVVAEGVENEAQFAWLGEARCDQYQGYLFSRPLPERSFTTALAKGFAAALK